jgi:hypothetical protein
MSGSFCPGPAGPPASEVLPETTSGGESQSVTTWLPPALFAMALAYAATGFLVKPGPVEPVRLIAAAGWPFCLALLGLAPMLAVAFVNWKSRAFSSIEERRARLAGAAMSAVLFIPALLVARSFQ